jgi:hypothetical protein
LSHAPALISVWCWGSGETFEYKQRRKRIAPVRQKKAQSDRIGLELDLLKHCFTQTGLSPCLSSCVTVVRTAVESGRGSVKEGIAALVLGLPDRKCTHSTTFLGE